MQKQANLSSIALRLNNLEQKFDEKGEEGGDEAFAKRLANMTIAGAHVAGGTGAEWSSVFYEKYSTSITAVLFGNLLTTSHDMRIAYLESAHQRSFFEQIFGGSAFYFNKFSSTDDFGRFNKSLCAALFNNLQTDENGYNTYLDYFSKATVSHSLCSTVFGKYSPSFFNNNSS